MMEVIISSNAASQLNAIYNYYHLKSINIRDHIFETTTRIEKVIKILTRTNRFEDR